MIIISILYCTYLTLPHGKVCGNLNLHETPLVGVGHLPQALPEGHHVRRHDLVAVGHDS